MKTTKSDSHILAEHRHAGLSLIDSVNFNCGQNKVSIQLGLTSSDLNVKITRLKKYEKISHPANYLVRI
jgi:hypothetical protein